MKQGYIFILLLTPTLCLGQATILQGVAIVDVEAGQIMYQRSIEIRSGKIYKIHEGNYPGMAGDLIMQLPGKFVIPGLIDSHTHIEHSGYWAIDSKYNPPRSNLVELLQHALLGGVTTIREMACDVRKMAELSRAASIDLFPSPDIYYPSVFAGPPFFLDPRAQAGALGAEAGNVSWFRAVDGPGDLPEWIAQAKGNGSVAIKTYALLDANLLKAISNEAKKQGMSTWSHAYTQFSRPSEVIESGVSSISHAHMLLTEFEGKPDYSSYPEDDALIQQLFEIMVEHQVSLDPTLFIYKGPERKDMITTARLLTRKAHEAGVMIVAGTDSISAYRAYKNPFIHREIEDYVIHCGMTPFQALRTATLNPARVLGLEQQIGTIAEGKVANLVVLERNPIDDIRNTTSILLVLKNGIVHRR